MAALDYTQVDFKRLMNRTLVSKSFTDKKKKCRFILRFFPDININSCCETVVEILLSLETILKDLGWTGDRPEQQDLNPDWHKALYAKVLQLIDYKSKENVIEDVCEKAASYGHELCLNLARYLGVPWHSPSPSDYSACDLAAGIGDLNCLKVAFYGGSRRDKSTCAAAAADGHLECLRFLHENGCEWDVETCNQAAAGGHLECVKYAHENGCEWDEVATMQAAVNGHESVLDYLHENNCALTEKLDLDGTH
ncbi:hypothetical protein AGLY_009232 [Aphis glycines]|uniref:Uncharacterized protein n=1 Tax=Aphis glycines TaxID=307491 RepID=A0A6G0TKX7_APHGL|nr:hypothetical protein AGLY_009232 [Aphis glycines]